MYTKLRDALRRIQHNANRHNGETCLDCASAAAIAREALDAYIPRKELVVGRAYYVDARNFQYAIWTGHAFAGLRHKFGDAFIDEEHHYDDDPYHGTVKPLELLGDPE